MPPCSRGQPDGRRAMIAPSGEQIEIAVGDQQAVVVEVGGRGQVLIPWPNRLQGGRYEIDGRRHQLPLNEPEHRNAIHGLARWATWTTAECDQQLPPSDGDCHTPTIPRHERGRHGFECHLHLPPILRLDGQRASVGEEGWRTARVEENDVVVWLPPSCPYE